ncbi:MAG: aspartate aminotransferase family protein [Verrucomicrobia bacterium]|nr:aspartate aminotransferase family protein [Verrucomicrobiota bacterium]
MSGRSYSLIPHAVPTVCTKHRRICTQMPAPKSVPILKALRQYEPVSMSGQPPVIWDRGEGVHVHDRWGNMWLDWSSGVLVANAGHGHKKIVEAICKQARHGLLHNYCFPSEGRAQLARELSRAAPPGLKKVFLLTTGSETIECAIKLARTHGQRAGGSKKIYIVSFVHAFHGRTMGAQMAGGIPALKEWIVNLDPAMIQVPFPDGFRTKDVSFSVFLKSLEQQKVTPDQVAGVMSETYQGGPAAFAPPAYMQELRRWCDQHKALLIFDEVQAGFGRTGTFWGFEHYGVVPDLFCCGKGISSSLPLAAVIGRPEIMDLYPPGSMTSTHSGSPIPVASAMANLQALRRERLVENARKMGALLHKEISRVAGRFSSICGAVQGKGLVAGIHIVKPGGEEPDGDRAFDIVRRCVEKGLLLFSPVGFGGATVKIAPPLVIKEDAILEGVAVLEEAIQESLQS